MPIKNTLAAKISDLYCNFEKNQHNIPVGRRRFNQICSLGAKPKILSVSDHVVASIPVRHYSNSTDKDRPTLLFFHGGGFVLGSIASHDTLCRRIARYANINIISVGYSLAPEHKFPVQVNEGSRVLDRILSDKLTFISNGPLLIGGDSAGGTIAASIVQNYSSKISGLLLLYPMLDLRAQHPSVDRNGIKKNFLTKGMIEWFIGQYKSPNTNLDYPGFSPIHAPSNSLVPTFIVAGTLDQYVDEAKDYVQKLKKANIHHVFVNPKNTIHGFMQFPSIYGYPKVLQQFKQFIKSLNDTVASNEN